MLIFLGLEDVHVRGEHPIHWRLIGIVRTNQGQNVPGQGRANRRGLPARVRLADGNSILAL